MPDNAGKQIIVTVKKSDGTFVKVPLSELKKPATPPAPAPAPTPKPVAPVSPAPSAPKPAQPAPQVPPRPATMPKELPKPVFKPLAQPGKPRVMPAPAKISISKEDMRSPLEETPLASAGDVKNIRDLKKELKKTLPRDFLPMVEPNEIPASYLAPPVPSTTTPFNSFVHGKEGKVEQPKVIPPRAPFKITSAEVPLAMQDIVGAEKTFGPLEELKFVTLTDFRRLSKNPAEAAKRLGQKFLNLKEESYLLFLQAWSAWRKSPLFQAYLGAVLDSLQKGVALEAVVTGLKDSIQMPEIEALVNMEKDLG